MPGTAQRLKKLGTETAYAVAEEAAKHAKEGNKVYALHIGDINIPTPKCVSDAMKKAVDEGKTGYCPASGIAPLRETIANYFTETRGTKFTADEVSVQPGGKPVIYKFLLAIMEEGDEILYPTPGYPIYESCISYYGGVLKPYIYKDSGSGFEIDMEYLKKQITPKTKALIYNNYHNPSGCASSDQEMKEIAELCKKHDLWVLDDQAYYQLVYDGPAKSIVSLPGMKERTVILWTFSKIFSMTGWRLGAAVGPKEIIAIINKINTNAEACTTHFVQYGGIAALTHPDAKKFTEDLKQTLKNRRDLIFRLANKIPGFKAYLPPSAFYLFVEVTEAMKMKGVSQLEDFRRMCLKETGVSFCTREHFGTPLPFETRKYIRFAFASADEKQISEAMEVLVNWMSKKTDESSSQVDVNGVHSK